MCRIAQTVVIGGGGAVVPHRQPVLDNQCEEIEAIGFGVPGLGSFSNYRSISLSAAS